MNELPFETWERIFHEPWPGGTSAPVVNLLHSYGIHPFGIFNRPGSAEANTALQEALTREHDSPFETTRS
jgi:hypothetical protein